MLYYATASTERVRVAMRAGLLGQIITPASGNRLVPGVRWCADNAVYANRYPGDDKYLAWLAARTWAASLCSFAVAPDVVGDAAATLARSEPMLPRIRALGLPVALAAQNGLERLTVPWDNFDVLFIGGDTAWKLGLPARQLVADARRRGKATHMGRVNSNRRLQYAAAIGCDSADGTYIAFGPDQNLPRLLWWLRPTLFDNETRPTVETVHHGQSAHEQAGAFPQLRSVEPKARPEPMRPQLPPRQPVPRPHR